MKELTVDVKNLLARTESYTYMGQECMQEIYMSFCIKKG